jgi:hypothetical protein
MTKEITLLKWDLVNINSWNEQSLVDSVLSELSILNIWSWKIASKLQDLLDSKTLNAKWDEMNDNRTQLEALKLLLKLHWVKVDQWININLFNIPKPDEKLRY